MGERINLVRETLIRNAQKFLFINTIVTKSMEFVKIESE